MRANDTAALRARGLTTGLGFGSAPALLVVDLIRAFTEPARPFGSQLDAELAQVARLLDAARCAHVPVVFTTVEYSAADLADAGLWAMKVPASRTLRPGTADVELDPRLGRRAGERVVVKKFASAFFGTDLAAHLSGAGVDTLVLAGASTSGCVRATAVDGLQHGFRVIVPREAVGDRNPAAHEQSLFDIDAKYGDVVPVERALAGLRALPEGADAEPALP